MDAPAPAGPSRRRRDVALDPWSHVRVALFCGGVFVWLYGASQDAAWVERVWLPNVGLPAITWVSWITGWVPLSIAEILVALLVATTLLRGLAGLSDLAAGRRGVVNVFGAWLLHGLSLSMVLLAWFQVVWGASYARAPLGERLGLVVAAEVARDPASVAAVEARLASVIDRVNASYRAIHGRDDAGEVTVPRADVDPDAMLERAFARLSKQVTVGGEIGHPRPPVKAVFLSDAFGWLGIGGIFVPFTGEATVNAAPPAWSLVMTMAHEKAHQRFVAPEDEATFVGVLAGLSSDEPLLRYGAWMTVRSQLARTLHKLDPEAAKRQDERLLPGPRRDREAVRDYWRRFEGPAQEVSAAVNDTYLKANGVEDGVVAYSRAARLIDAWLQTDAGRRALSGRPLAKR